MKIVSRMVCICFIVLLSALVSVAKAIPFPDATLPELVQQSDVVCVGVAVKTTSQGKTAVDTGLTFGSKPYLQNGEAMVADFAVQDVLMGTLSSPKQNVKIRFARNTPGLSVDVLPFTELVVGERVLVFLKKGANDDTFQLAFPINKSPAKVFLGRTVVPKDDPAASPFRKVLLYLTAALSDNDKAVQLDCLTRLQRVGFLLNLSPRTFGNSSPALRILRALQEPEAPQLEDFITGRVLPPVLTLLSSPDAVVRTNAVIAAGDLQDVDAIPLLVKLMDEHPKVLYSDASFALESYRVKDAVRPLALLLKSKTVAVKRSAAYALREIADPRSISFLIDQLDDPATTIREILVSGLFFITGEKAPTAIDQDDQSHSKAILFWKQWARDHQDKLKALRAQLEDAPLSPALP